MKSSTRSYKLSTYLNKAKELKLTEVITQQQEYLLEDSILADQLLRLHGKVPQYRPAIKSVAGLQVMRRNSWAQVKNAYRVWEARAVELGKSLITQLELEQDLAYQVFTLNKHKCWLQPELIRRITITDEAAKIAGEVFHEILATLPTPVVGDKLTIQLSNGVELKKNHSSNSFDYWLQVPSLTPRKPILIPIKSSDYFENAPGVLSNNVTLQIGDYNEVTLTLTKTEEEAGYSPLTSEVIALDWGVSTLFTTSDGRELGKELYSHLQRLDAKLLDLQGKLQTLGVPLKGNKRYLRLQAQIRESVKNVVGRVLNQLSDEGWAGLVVESLDFRGKSFSKKFNRLLQRAGRGAVRAKLQRFEEEGIPVHRVNPAYSSQECSGCGFVHKANRNGKNFSCCFCGKRAHADVNAARNIRKRFLDGHSWQYCSGEQVKAFLDEKFRARWGLSFTEVGFRQDSS